MTIGAADAVRMTTKDSGKEKTRVAEATRVFKTLKRQRGTGVKRLAVSGRISSS
jgi:hypothetical protein